MSTISVTKKDVNTKNKTKVTKKRDNTKKESEVILRLPAEQRYNEELEYLHTKDNYPKPKNWFLSPHMLKIFIIIRLGRCKD